MMRALLVVLLLTGCVAPKGTAERARQQAEDDLHWSKGVVERLDLIAQRQQVISPDQLATALAQVRSERATERVQADGRIDTVAADVTMQRERVDELLEQADALRADLEAFRITSAQMKAYYDTHREVMAQERQALRDIERRHHEAVIVPMDFLKQQQAKLTGLADAYAARIATLEEDHRHRPTPWTSDQIKATARTTAEAVLTEYEQKLRNWTFDRLVALLGVAGLGLLALWNMVAPRWRKHRAAKAPSSPQGGT